MSNFVKFLKTQANGDDILTFRGNYTLSIETFDRNETG